MKRREVQWYGIAVLVWLLGRRHGRDEGRQEGYARAADIFGAGVRAGRKADQ